jgi:hypothetical protein
MNKLPKFIYCFHICFLFIFDPLGYPTMAHNHELIKLTTASTKENFQLKTHYSCNLRFEDTSNPLLY